MSTPWAINVTDENQAGVDGAIGDARVVTSINIRDISGTSTVTAAANTFSGDDKGKTVTVVGAIPGTTGVPAVSYTSTVGTASDSVSTDGSTIKLTGAPPAGGFSAATTTLVIGTENTAAIQAALDRAKETGGNLVCVPPGNYLLAPDPTTHTSAGATYALVIPDNVTLCGVRGASVLTCYQSETRMILVAGSAKADADDPLAATNWAIQGSVGTPTVRICAIKPIVAPSPPSDGYYGNTLILNQPGDDLDECQAGRWIVIRTGELDGPNTNQTYRQPDCEVNQIVAVVTDIDNDNYGQLTLRFPLTKPYDPEYYLSDLDAPTPTVTNPSGSTFWASGPWVQPTNPNEPAPFGVCVMKTSADEATLAQNVHIRELTFDHEPDADGSTIYVLQAWNVSVEDCDFLSYGSFPLGGRYARDVVFSNNIVCQREPLFSTTGSDGQEFKWVGPSTGFTHMRVTDNRFYGGYTARVHIQEGVANVLFAGNAIAQPQSEGGASSFDAISVKARSYDLRCLDNLLINSYQDASTNFVGIGEPCVAGGLISRNVLRGETAHDAVNDLGTYWIVSDNTFPTGSTFTSSTTDAFTRNVNCNVDAASSPLSWEEALP